VILAVDKLAILKRKIRRSPQKFQNYSAICTVKNMKPLMPIIDVPTRSNLTLDMLERAFLYLNCLDSLAFESKWFNLIVSEQEWECVSFVISVLSPSKDASIIQSGSNAISLNNSVSIYEFLLTDLTS
jgi:hypothetical protein